MGCSSYFAIPGAGLGFFFSAWLLMIFWGIVSPWFNIATISYINAMLVTLAIWLIVAPLAATAARIGVRKAFWR